LKLWYTSGVYGTIKKVVIDNFVRFRATSAETIASFTFIVNTFRRAIRRRC
jgi:hypothetical protein